MLRMLQKVSPERNIEKAVDTFNGYIEANPQSSRYITSDEIGKLFNPPPEGFAEGGMVGDPIAAYDPLQIDSVMNSIDAPRAYAQGGSVSVYDPTRIDEIMNGIDEPRGYDEGGSVLASEEDTLDTFVAPRYRKQRAKPSSKETKAAMAKAAKFASEMLIPQTAMDAGLMLIPGGKIARKAGAALIALDAGDAEAGGLSSLMKLLSKEAPEQANKIREALRLTKQTGREHSVIGLANEGGESVITRGSESAVLPNSFDLRTAKRAPGSPTIVDFHTHPGQGTIFETAPSRQDFQFYSSEYPSKAGRDLRTLVAVPPTKDGARRTTSYNFFETQDPAKKVLLNLFKMTLCCVSILIMAEILLLC